LGGADSAVEKADSFHILQVSPDATLQEARSAYMRLVKRWHPDRFADNPRMRESAQEKLKLINSAYEIVTAAISARIERGRPRKVATPPSVSPGNSPNDSPPDIVEPLAAGTIFSAFRNRISNRIRRFFSSSTIKTPPPVRNRKNSPRAGTPSGGTGEKKDFQKIFNDAVRSKTGRPYRPPGRTRGPLDRSEKETPTRAQTAAVRPIYARRKAGRQVARVEPVSKIRGF
jgi:curved DNA-binding protein CbpA